jgi:hypothetical protein
MTIIHALYLMYIEVLRVEQNDQSWHLNAQHDLIA